MTLTPDTTDTLGWSQMELKEYIAAGIVAKPTDFGRSWQNGVALLCLIHRVEPSRVPDISSLVAWLSKPSADPQTNQTTLNDPATYLANLKLLKIVYSADLLQWQSTCERALRLSRDVVPLHSLPAVPTPESLCNAQASKEVVEALVNLFRARLSSIPQVASTSVTIEAPRAIAAQDASFELVEQPKAAPVIESGESTTKNVSTPARSFWDMFSGHSNNNNNNNNNTQQQTTTIAATASTDKAKISEQPRSDTREIILIDKVASPPVQAQSSTPPPPPPALVIDEPTEAVIFKPSFPQAPPPTPIVETPVSIPPTTTTTTTTTTVTENKWNNPNRTFAEVVKNEPPRPQLESVTSVTTTTIKDIEMPSVKTGSPSTSNAIDTGVSVKSLSRAFNPESSDTVSSSYNSPTKRFVTPRRSSLMQKAAASPSEEHFKTIVTTTTTKTVTGENGEPVVVVEKNVEVVEDENDVPSSVKQAAGESVTMVTEVKEDNQQVVEAETGHREETAVAIDSVSTTILPTAVAEVPTVPGDREVVVVAQKEEKKETSTTSSWNPFARVVQAIETVAHAVESAVESVVPHSGYTPVQDAPAEKKKKRRVLRNKFAPTGPGMIYSDNDYTDEESEDEKAAKAKVVEKVAEESAPLLPSRPEVTTGVTNRDIIIDSNAKSVSHADGVSSPTQFPSSQGLPQSNLVEKSWSTTIESKPEPIANVDKNGSGNVIDHVPKVARTPSYARPTASSLHHAAAPTISSGSSSLSHHHYNRNDKNHMIASMKEMQAEVDLAAKKITASVKKEELLPPPSEAPLPPAAAGGPLALKTVEVTSSAGNTDYGKQPDNKELQDQDFKKKSTIVKLKPGTSGNSNTSTITTFDKSPTAKESTSTTSITTTTTTATTPTTASATATTPVVSKPLVYSETYRNHIAESETVLTVCEQEVRARNVDYASFAREDLINWMDEIAGTARMFVDVGGEVLDAEWASHGFKGDGIVAPHVALVERARAVVGDVERLRSRVM